MITQTAAASTDMSGLRDLAQSLGLEGRTKDARLLLEHLDSLQFGNVETLRQLVRAGRRGADAEGHREDFDSQVCCD